MKRLVIAHTDYETVVPKKHGDEWRLYFYSHRMGEHLSQESFATQSDAEQSAINDWGAIPDPRPLNTD